MRELIAILATVLSFSSVFGQGQILFNNRTPTGDAPVCRPDGTGAGAGFTAQLFLVGEMGLVTPLFPSTTFRDSSPAAAYFVNPVQVTVPGVPVGSSAVVRMRFWEGASYDTATLKGESNDITIASLGGTPADGGAPIPLPGLSGLQGAAFIPEPSSLAIILLGISALASPRSKGRNLTS